MEPTLPLGRCEGVLASLAIQPEIGRRGSRHTLVSEALMQAYQLSTVSAVKCMLCGRRAGRVVEGQFLLDPSSEAPVLLGSNSRCGKCFGNLYVEDGDRVIEREVVHVTNAANGMQSPRMMD